MQCGARTRGRVTFLLWGNGGILVMEAGAWKVFGEGFFFQSNDCYSFAPPALELGQGRERFLRTFLGQLVQAW